MPTWQSLSGPLLLRPRAALLLSLCGGLEGWFVSAVLISTEHRPSPPDVLLVSSFTLP